MSTKKSEKILQPVDVCERCYDLIKRNEDVKNRFTKTINNKNICAFCGVDIHDDIDNSDSENRQKYKDGKNFGNIFQKHKFILLLASLICLVVFFGRSISYISQPSKDNFSVDAAVKKLKQKYSKENRVLWQNVMKIVDDSENAVHSFVLLYQGNGSNAAECFAKDLIKIINKIHGNTVEVIYKNKNYVVEYGEELNEYMKIVRENKHMIVPKLQNMSGETARMFHTLCDVGENAIKPSYFIFTLEDTSDNIAPDLKAKNPFVRAGNILRKTWSNLAENELHPLISRILRNVAEISEVNVSC